MRRFPRAAVLFFAAAVLTACGQKEDKKTASQVAATVNGYEITVHQVNNVLARQNVPAERAEQAKRQILERLIDQQLARQQALERKLDRTPNVVQALEAARTEILAGTYLQQLAKAQPPATPEEIKKFYAERPELFAERRLFALEEINLAASEPHAKALAEEIGRARSIAEVAGWLRTRKVDFSESRGIRAAEQIALDHLPRLQKMKDGEIAIFDHGERLQVVRLAARQASPVDEASATPRIQQYIHNRRVTDAIAEEARRLREKSNIEYLGEFAQNAPVPATKAPKPEAAPAVPADRSLDKGVRGLR